MMKVSIGSSIGARMWILCSCVLVGGVQQAFCQGPDESFPEVVKKIAAAERLLLNVKIEGRFWGRRRRKVQANGIPPGMNQLQPRGTTDSLAARPELTTTR